MKPDARGIITRICASGAAVILLAALPGQSSSANANEYVLTIIGRAPQRFATLEGALVAARQARASPLPAGDVVITLPPGVLHLSAPITLTARDSGTASNPLVLRGAGVTTVLSGGSTIGHSNAAGGIQVSWPAHQGEWPLLFAGDRLLTPVGWPDGSGLETWSVTKNAGQIVLGSQTQRVANSPWTQIAGYFSYDWQFEVLPAQVVNGQIVVARKNLSAEPQSVIRASALYGTTATTNGHFNRIGPARVRVHLAKPGPVEAPVPQHIVSITNAHHIRLESIVFEKSAASAIRILLSSDVEVSDCTVRATGAWGAEVDGGYRVRIRRCLFQDLGAGGVRLNGGNRETLEPTGHEVADSIIHRFAIIKRTYSPGVALAGVGSTVRNTLIADAPHVGIVLDGNEHRVINNQLAALVCETSDAAAVYMGRDWSARGNLVARNYIHDIGHGKDILASAIYLDDQFSGTVVKDNVIIGASHGIFMGGGRDNLLSGNVFADIWRSAVWFDNRGQTWQKPETAQNGILHRRLLASPYQSSAWRQRYPDLPRLLLDEPGVPKGNQLNSNIVYAAPLLWSQPGDLEIAQQDNQVRASPPRQLTGDRAVDYMIVQSRQSAVGPLSKPLLRRAGPIKSRCTVN